MQEQSNEPHEHNTSQANQQPHPQLSTQVNGDSISLDFKKKETCERLKEFITTFFNEFTETLKNYRNETNVPLRINTTSQNIIRETAVGLIEHFYDLLVIVVRPLNVTVNYVINRCHRKKAKRIVDVFRYIEEDELRNMLAEAGGNIFYDYQIQFNMITDVDNYWSGGMKKLARDAMRRAISYINQYKQYNPEMNVSVDLICEGIKLGKYRQGFIGTAMQKAPRMLKPGHTVKIYNEEYKTSEVYENLIKMDDDAAGKCYSKKDNGSNSRKSKDTSGLTQISNEDCQELIEQPEKEHTYILSLEKVIEQAKRTLEKLNDDTQRRTMNEMIDIVIANQESRQKKEPIYFDVKCPVKAFTGRGNELERLHEMLQDTDRNVVISQVAAVTGLGGIGKSELVRKYAIEYAGHYDNNVIWINSDKHENLTMSFERLAVQELNMSIDEEINKNTQKIQVNSIVKNVYKYFNKVKSLFIFDNAEEYTVIEKFLPTSLLPNGQRPYILITSRNQDWDVGFEGRIHVMQLNVFTQEEATMFIKNSIERNDLQMGDIEKLTERLQYFPLALAQAVAYINQENKMSSKRWNDRWNKRWCEGFKISDYLKILDENAKKLLNESYSKNSDRYTNTVLNTWVTTLEKIEEDQDHGTKAIDILYVMAYLAPDNIHASILFDNESSHYDNESCIQLCDKYSMIDLKSGGVASIHRLVQEVIRVMLKDGNKEEEVIKKALTLIRNNEKICEEYTNHVISVWSYASHVISVWSYASRYSTLIHEFYINSNSISTYGYNNATPLHLLAENGDHETVEAILDKVILVKREFPEKFSKIIDAKDKYNRTPLYMAVENGYASVVKLFVDKEARLDIKSTVVYNSLSTKRASEWTPLHVAAFNGYSDIIKILVDKDARLVHIKDNIDRTAAVLAAFNGQINDLEILNPDSYNVYLLHAKFRAARRSGNLQDLENFLKNLEKEQLQNMVNEKLGEWAPLHLAAFANWLNITRILVDNGAKVRDDTPSFTPLHSASSNGHLDIIKYLIGNGACPTDINEDGWTSLHAAAQNGHLHVVKYFINTRKINVDITDNARATPLHTAAYHGKLDVVKFLLNQGANIKAVNIVGATPLFLAAINNNRDVYDFLLNKDATVVNTSNDQTLIGRLKISVLHVAAVYNDKEMVEDLLNKGVDKDIGEGTSLTPLYFAIFFDSLEVIKYLIDRGATINASINIPVLRELLEETIRDSTSESYSIPEFVSTLSNFVNNLPKTMNNLSAKDLMSFIEKLKCRLVPDFGRLIDSLKIYVEQKKNPDLDIPLHAVLFTQKVSFNFTNDGE